MFIFVLLERSVDLYRPRCHTKADVAVDRDTCFFSFSNYKEIPRRGKRVFCIYSDIYFESFKLTVRCLADWSSME